MKDIGINLYFYKEMY